MNTPGTALIVVVLVDGSRIAFEAEERGAWFAPAMKQAGDRITMRGVTPRRLIVIGSREFHRYSGAAEIQELTGIRLGDLL